VSAAERLPGARVLPLLRALSPTSKHWPQELGLRTLKVLADHLGVLPLELLTFPEDDERQRLVDRIRTMSSAEIKKLLKALADQDQR